MAFVALNPVRQIEKAKDARRQHDLTQIRSSLDSYLSDRNCYPDSITMGGTLSRGSTVYMQTIPQDPDYSGGGASYLYETDGSSCPQWNVLFAKLSTSENLQTSCALAQLSNCLPTNYTALGYNYCVVSGDVNCSYISTNPLPNPVTGSATPMPTPSASATPLPTPSSSPTPSASPTPSPSPTSSPTPAPSPTPPPFNCSPNYYAVSSGRCNIVVPSQCYIYGGTLTCYSGPGTTTCTGQLCTQ